MMIFILVPAIAPMLGQGILMLWSWRAIFMMYVIFSVIIAVWIFLRLPETLKPEDKIPFSTKAISNGFRTVFANRSTMSYMVCMGIMFGSFIGYLNSCQQIFQVQFGVGENFVFYFGGLALVFGASSLCNSKIVVKVGMHKICRWSSVCIIAISALFLAVNLMMPVTLWMFIPFVAVLFFAFGLMFGNLNAIAMEPMGHIAGIASAVIGSVSSAISMVIGITIGQLYDGTLIPVVSGFLILNLLSLAIMQYERRLPAPAAI
jgi:DHA1 family bicyclomycin/chloramphenicol resistance-like MFS transporter